MYISIVFRINQAERFWSDADTLRERFLWCGWFDRRSCASGDVAVNGRSTTVRVCFLREALGVDYGSRSASQI